MPGEDVNSDQSDVQESIYEWDVAQVGDASPPFVYDMTAEGIF